MERACYRLVRSRHMFAGRVGASSQSSGGELLPIPHDVRHFFGISLARLKWTEPGGGADRYHGLTRQLEGAVVLGGGYAFC